MAKRYNSFDGAEGALNVTLHECSFAKDGSLYGKVSRRTVGLEQIIAYETSKNEGVSGLMVQHAAALLQDGILSLLSMGYSVNVLGLGTMYLGTQGKITGDKVSDVPSLCAKFTPSTLTSEMAAKVSVDAVLRASYTPIMQNYPQSQDFQVPKSLSVGSKYYLAVRTQIGKSNNALKSAITGFSDVIEIVEDID